MAQITLTEILGGDNISASRTDFNNNFKTIQSAINTLETYLNSSVTPGAALSVGYATVKKYTRPITTLVFVVEASGEIQGNLSILGDTNLGGNLSTGLDLNVKRNVSFTDDAPGSPDAYVFTNELRTVNTDGESHSQAYAYQLNAPLITPNSLLPGAAATRNIPTVGLEKYRILHIDWSAFTGIGSDCVQLILPVATIQGQLLKIVIDDAAATFPAGTFTIAPSTVAGSGLDPIYDAVGGIFLNSTFTTNTDFKKVWVDLMYSSTGWKVIGAHPDVTY